MKKIMIAAFGLLFTAHIALAASYTAGKDYTVINAKLPSQKTVKVVEFFNYGCPWCAHIDPAVEKWKETTPDYIDFDRISVAFEAGWDTYSKAYYFAKALDIEKKITPLLFTAIHGSNDQQYHDLSSTKAMTDFFVKHGVKRADFENGFNSASLELQAKQGLPLMRSYNVSAIPTFVVAGKYSVSLGQAKTPESLMKTVDYLIQLAHKS